MIRQFFFLGGERIDDLYGLRRLFYEKPEKQGQLMAELMRKYESGLFSEWLQGQIYDKTKDSEKKEAGHFKGIRNRYLNAEDEQERKDVKALLCELCGVTPELELPEVSAAESKKRAELSVYPWYLKDPMKEIKDWNSVVLEASELKSTMASVVLSDLEQKSIHLCNNGKEQFDLKGLKLPGIHVVGHGHPVCVLSDPRLNAAAELDLSSIPGLVLEGLVLRGKCALTGMNEGNWIDCAYERTE